MSINVNHIRSGSDRSQQIRLNGDEYEIDIPSRKDSLPNILPEVDNNF